MITATSIQLVKDRMDVIDVISEFIKLDRNNKACCPFHTEKSPSFSVNAKRQIYKCFGCGASGDAIAFIMQHEKKDFMQTIEWLAQRYNIALEVQEENEQQKKKREQQKDIMGTLHKAVEFAYSFYHKNLRIADKNTNPWQYLIQRGYTEETALFWGFGFAPEEWQFLSSPIINAGLYDSAATVGLVRTKEGRTFDFYRNRLIIPIHNLHGQVTGLAGRWIPTGDPEKDSMQAKYMNPSESPVYQKSKTWFGLYQANIAKAFVKTKDGIVPPAFIVEGYLDVIAMHENGIQNTVAACGTAVTFDQIRLLKRYTQHFVLLADGDSAGKNSAIKTIDLCLQENIRVDVVELPDGEDPDSYSKKYLLS